MIDVLILEDDPESSAALVAWLEQHRLQVRLATTLAEARALIAERIPDLGLLDVNLPDGSGLDVLAELVPTGADVVMISGQTTTDDAIGALRFGASDFLPKPADTARLTAIVKNVRRRLSLRNEIRDLRGRLKTLGRFGTMVGQSAAMQLVYECIERVAPTDETVLVTGPTGTGKEVTSTTIHDLSRRRDGPFVALNCGAISASLIESEFFGHEKGAFTGADKRRKGVFERANGGTLFLDEVSEMPIDLQVKLLRVLETRQITRVGGTDVIDVDVRIIAATNRDLRTAVDDGKLRQDLLYRLLVFPIELPPLKDREGDVRLLAKALLATVNQEYDVDKRLATATLKRLEAHTWPGNVRELANVVRRAHIMAPAQTILVDHLPLPPLTGDAPITPTGSTDQGKAFTIEPGTSIAAAEQKLIQATLDQLDGDKKKAARLLGISLKTLYARLQVYAASSPVRVPIRRLEPGGPAGEKEGR